MKRQRTLDVLFPHIPATLEFKERLSTYDSAQLSAEVLTASMSNTEASKLLQDTLDSHAKPFGFGSFSCSVYDTAWVSCVSRNLNGSRHAVFPSSVAYVRESQCCDGSWPVSGSISDVILTTLAAMHALTVQKESIQAGLSHNEAFADNTLGNQLEKAAVFLRHTLQKWSVPETDSVGFEILIPAHLDLLSESGHSFDFRDKSYLYELRNQRLIHFLPSMLYGDQKTTLLHSLEAMVAYPGFDFDRIAHHKTGGSMMASPSSTAAYLMCCSAWDSEAEEYLRTVLVYGSGKGNGAVPSAFPTGTFELIWVSLRLQRLNIGTSHWTKY